MDRKRLTVVSLCAVLSLGAVACGDDAEGPAGGAEIEGGGGEGGDGEGDDGY